MNPSISVALTTYNGARFLPAQLDSIAAQDLRPGEVIIGDDQSTDGTTEIIERFAASQDIPVRWQRNPTRLGSSANFQQVAARCQGDIIVFADQDDVWLPGRLARVAAAFAADPHTGYVFSDGLLVDEQDRRLPGTLFSGVPFDAGERRQFQQGGALEVLLRHNVVTGAALAVRRTALARILPFEPGWVHDYYIAIMLAALGPVTLLDEPLIQYRRHGGQQVSVAGGSVRAVLALARRQDAEHLRQQADNFRRLRDRLLALGLDPARPIVAALSAKARFLDLRAQMKDQPARAPAVIWRAWRQGDYRTYALGWKQVALDLLSVAPLTRGP